MPSALIIGAQGSIGRPLLAQLRAAGWDALGTARRAQAGDGLARLDLEEPLRGTAADARLQGFLESGPVAYLLAARNRYADCENNPADTRLVNVERTVELASQLIRHGAFVVFPSSTAVFSGAGSAPDEGARPDPQTEYGRQKADAERAIRELARRAPAGAGAAIVRISKVVDADESKRPGEWLPALANGVAVDAAPNLTMAPVSMDCLGRGLRRIGERRVSGTYHLSGMQAVSYYEFARLLAAALGCREELVRARDAPAPPVAADRLEMGEASRRAGLEPQQLASAVADLVAQFRENR